MLGVLLSYTWTIFQIIAIIFFVQWLRKNNKDRFCAAKLGFVVLFLSMLASLIKQFFIAGKLAEFSWILFTISYIQQVIYYLKYERSNT